MEPSSTKKGKGPQKREQFILFLILYYCCFQLASPGLLLLYGSAFSSCDYALLYNIQSNLCVCVCVCVCVCGKEVNGAT